MPFTELSAKPSLVRAIKHSTRKARFLRKALAKAVCEKVEAGWRTGRKLKATATALKALKHVLRDKEEEAVVAGEALEVVEIKLQHKQKALNVKEKEADLAGEALASASLVHAQREEDFRAFQDEAGNQLTASKNRAEEAEGSLVIAEDELRRQQVTNRKQASRHLTLQWYAEGKLRSAEAKLSRGQAANRKQGQDLADYQGQYSLLLEALKKSEGDRAALQAASLVDQKNLADWQREYSALQGRLSIETQALAGAKDRASKAEENLKSAVECGRELEARLAAAALVPTRAAAPSASGTAPPPPAASQVAAHQHPVLSWVQTIIGNVSLPMKGSVIMAHFAKNLNDSAALEGCVRELQKMTSDAMPRKQQWRQAQKKTFMGFVTDGPPGWVLPSVVPQGHPTAQAGNVGTGSAPFSGTGSGTIPPVTNGASSSFGLRLTSSSFPASVPVPAPAFASTTATAPASAFAPRCVPAFAFATAATNSTTAALGAPSIPVAAPTPATFGVRAVSGGKSTQSDSRGATSDRSKRRIGP